LTLKGSGWDSESDQNKKFGGGSEGSSQKKTEAQGEKIHHQKTPERQEKRMEALNGTKGSWKKESREG